jgi:hypothetical protein
LGFLGLQEERVRTVDALEQQDPGAGPDAADPDHLAGELHQFEFFQQVLTIALQRSAISAYQTSQCVVDDLRLGRSP